MLEIFEQYAVQDIHILVLFTNDRLFRFVQFLTRKVLPVNYIFKRSI